GPVYNIVDDEPMRLAEFLSFLASAVGARPPREAPRWLIRLIAPVVSEAAFTRIPLSNGRARRELGWSPVHRSVRDEAFS
ncbi:MAG TPA: NAD(P)-dependent oxidoreductase, partial [Terriglobia bacterium]|nr:NAD(P)-dependent oxidoreductase [Terriglobia bacterium]